MTSARSGGPATGSRSARRTSAGRVGRGCGVVGRHDRRTVVAGARPRAGRRRRRARPSTTVPVRSHEGVQRHPLAGGRGDRPLDQFRTLDLEPVEVGDDLLWCVEDVCVFRAAVAVLQVAAVVSDEQEACRLPRPRRPHRARSGCVPRPAPADRRGSPVRTPRRRTGSRADRWPASRPRPDVPPRRASPSRSQPRRSRHR